MINASKNTGFPVQFRQKYPFSRVKYSFNFAKLNGRPYSIVWILQYYYYYPGKDLLSDELGVEHDILPVINHAPAHLSTGL